MKSRPAAGATQPIERLPKPPHLEGDAAVAVLRTILVEYRYLMAIARHI